MNDFRKAFVAALWTLAGALIGGIALWFYASHGATESLLAAFDWLPGISPGLIEKTRRALGERGLPALATGALAGQPYKLYAVHAGASGVGLGVFVAASLAARLARFLLTSALARTIGFLLKNRSESFRQRLHLAVWLGFYVFYFAVMRG